jgi:hypothetical protein
MRKLFDTQGNWYKGNLHMHTLNSDGKLSAESAIKLYREAGYDFIALTDHWVQRENKSIDGFLILNGCEFDTGDMTHHPIYHIIGIGMESLIPLQRCTVRHPQELINAIRAAKGIAILAHPAWSVTDPMESMELDGLCGAEIYNTLSGLPWNGSRADSSIYFDIWAAKGKLFNCMAADDSHFYNGEQTRSFIMVKAPELSAAAIKKALREGNFYASQGPRFESVSCDGKTVEVRCSEVETVVFYSNTVWCDDRVTTGGVNSATYQIKHTDTYVRIELIDAEGNRAWSSPMTVTG